MLGKAEYVKYVLNSVCRERARIFVSDKFLSEPATLKQLSNSDVESFLDEKGWYEEFMEEIPKDLRNLYRFAAFVSDNIGNITKDKFGITKVDNTAVEHAAEFSKKGQLIKFEKVPGEWHLQGIFIEIVKELKEAL
tara:strand:- start:177 stop:584 length:408 start_codon:yes stop_codon:yes gene_type:complete